MSANVNTGDRRSYSLCECLLFKTEFFLAIFGVPDTQLFSIFQRIYLSMFLLMAEAGLQAQMGVKPQYQYWEFEYVSLIVLEGSDIDHITKYTTVGKA